MMDNVIISIFFGIVGAILGSFAVASTWRLRACQLSSDKSSGYRLSKEEKSEFEFIKNLAKDGKSSKYSHCLHCHRQLNAFDMVPIISWVILGGKCRTCKKPIGKAEFFTEVGLCVAFFVSYLVWPLPLNSLIGWVLLIVWLLILLCCAIHIVYDSKWLLLLDNITMMIFILSILFVVLRYVLTGGGLQATLISLALSAAILPGLYGLLYFISKGAWIGFGDVKLLIPLSIMLPNWPYALLFLFLANFIGFVTLLPGVASGKVSSTARIPFGPFLIIAWFITMLWGKYIVQTYIGSAFIL